MATLGNTVPTLLDVSKQFSEDGTPLPLAELLTQMNPMLDDVPWYEANSTTGHRISARAGLPEATWRKLNGGTKPSKSTFQDVTESFGMLTSLGTVDKKLAEMSTNIAQFRVNENAGHIEAINQKLAQCLFYGDTNVDPEKFVGLSPRFDSLSAKNGSQIIDASGTDTDLFSIWLVGWGPNSVFGVYPKGTQAGLVHKDYGEELIDDGSGGKYPALRDWFEFDAGIAVKDWRNIVRIANIEVSALTKDASAGADLIDLMVQALEQLNNQDAVRPVFYMPRVARSFLRRQITNKDNVWLSMDEVAGRKTVAFDGVPVRRSDALLSTESQVQ
jgi:hypothetical protein